MGGHGDSKQFRRCRRLEVVRLRPIRVGVRVRFEVVRPCPVSTTDQGGQDQPCHEAARLEHHYEEEQCRIGAKAGAVLYSGSVSPCTVAVLGHDIEQW